MLDNKLKIALILTLLLAACSNNESDPGTAGQTGVAISSEAGMENNEPIQQVELVPEVNLEAEVALEPEVKPVLEVALAPEVKPALEQALAPPAKSAPVAEPAPAATPAPEVKPAPQPIQQAAVDSKPYQIVDGKPSENLMEGWRTYNGGGCGTCHGKGGIGAVGPNLADSLKSKISKDDFYELVKNGKPGTMMRPNNTNKRVMDNLDNLYAYILARSDGVLGPENLIKFPLGKSK